MLPKLELFTLKRYSMETPTAREFYDAHDSDDAVVMMIDFAKMHVEAALKAASEATLLYDFKEEITNSYPLENIK